MIQYLKYRFIKKVFFFAGPIKNGNGNGNGNGNYELINGVSIHVHLNTVIRVILSKYDTVPTSITVINGT